MYLGVCKVLFALDKFEKNIVLCTDSREITYRELQEKSNQIAEAIGHRCQVFLLCSNVPASIFGYVGMLNHGIVPVMLDSDLDEDLVQHLIEVYGPRFLWLPREKADDYPFYDEVLKLDGYVLLATGHNECKMHDNLALLMTTSGSTGSPKLVRISYGNLRSNTEAIVDYLGMDGHEVGITSLPMHYVYGLSIINTHLWTGASLVVTDKSLMQKEFWQLLKDKNVTNMGGVPYTYEMMKRLRFQRMDLPSLEVLTQAGGKLKPELHREFAEYAEQTGKKMVIMYGAAEATARMGYLPAEQALAKVGCMGVAIPGGRFELQAEDGQVIEEANVPGELIYYGANVTMGYAQGQADLAKDDENHGRYVTGDVAERDDDGYYRIAGRKKRFLKLFGKRTNLQEVEDILKQKYYSLDIACGGKDDKLVIFVAGQTGMEEKTLKQEILTYISGKLGLHHSAFAVKSIEAMPRNASGKVLYRELEQYYDL